jgi:hypothetical protein
MLPPTGVKPEISVEITGTPSDDKNFRVLSPDPHQLDREGDGISYEK